MRKMENNENIEKKRIQINHNNRKIQEDGEKRIMNNGSTSVAILGS